MPREKLVKKGGNYNTPVNFKDLTGKRFGKLIVISRAENKKMYSVRALDRWIVIKPIRLDRFSDLVREFFIVVAKKCFVFDCRTVLCFCTNNKGA